MKTGMMIEHENEMREPISDIEKIAMLCIVIVILAACIYMNIPLF